MLVRTGLHKLAVFLHILFPVELVRGVKAEESQGNIFNKRWRTLSESVFNQEGFEHGKPEEIN